jgi:hypothetical protein
MSCAGMPAEGFLDNDGDSKQAGFKRLRKKISVHQRWKTISVYFFSEKNSGIGYFSLNMDWMKKDFLKENTGYVCLVR